MMNDNNILEKIQEIDKAGRKSLMELVKSIDQEKANNLATVLLASAVEEHNADVGTTFFAIACIASQMILQLSGEDRDYRVGVSCFMYLLNDFCKQDFGLKPRTTLEDAMENRNET
jgi:hypothetical protein